jgi:hypothetical protein
VIIKPYFLTVRQFKDGKYTEGGRSGYIRHQQFATEPSNYVRAFEIIQKDLLTLFEFVEPSDKSLGTYSFRTFELLLRICTELEANFKSMLRANTYSKPGDLNIQDYYKVNKSHFLSKYEVELPYWTGRGRVRRPFKAWATSYHTLTWYKAYNDAKHDRAKNLSNASFENLIDAMCGLVVILTAQFLANDFGPRPNVLVTEGPNDGFETALGSYFRVKYPTNIPKKERYDFDWQTLQNDPSPFQKFDYDNV